jgi:hypothetical protein
VDAATRKELTHSQPDLVFWIYPDGRLHDARDVHAHNVPRGYEYILDDEPDYGGFLRGRQRQRRPVRRPRRPHHRQTDYT